MILLDKSKMENQFVHQFLHISDADIEAGIFRYLTHDEWIHIPSLAINLLIFCFKFEFISDLETNNRLVDWFQINRVEPVVQALLKIGKIQENKIDPKGRFTFITKVH